MYVSVCVCVIKCVCLSVCLSVCKCVRACAHVFYKKYVALSTGKASCKRIATPRLLILNSGRICE